MSDSAMTESTTATKKRSRRAIKILEYVCPDCGKQVQPKEVEVKQEKKAERKIDVQAKLKEVTDMFEILGVNLDPAHSAVQSANDVLHCEKRKIRSLFGLQSKAIEPKLVDPLIAPITVVIARALPAIEVVVDGVCGLLGIPNTQPADEKHRLDALLKTISVLNSSGKIMQIKVDHLLFGFFYGTTLSADAKKEVSKRKAAAEFHFGFSVDPHKYIVKQPEAPQVEDEAQDQ